MMPHRVQNWMNGISGISDLPGSTAESVQRIGRFAECAGFWQFLTAWRI